MRFDLTDRYWPRVNGRQVQAIISATDPKQPDNQHHRFLK